MTVMERVTVNVAVTVTMIATVHFTVVRGRTRRKSDREIRYVARSTFVNQLN